MQQTVDVPPPSAEDIGRTLDKLTAQLLEGFGAEVGPLLRRLIVGKIRAIPFRLFDSDRIRLRARFTLNVVRLLPEQWRSLLDDRAKSEDLGRFDEIQSITLDVDLFEPSHRIRHAKSVHRLVGGGLTIREAGRRLGIAETSANRAYRTGKALAERGLDDPYIEIKSMPKRPSRWRPQSKRPDVFDEE